MKELTNNQKKDLKSLVERLRIAEEGISGAIEGFNEQVNQIWESAVDGLLEAYNGLVQEANQFRESVSSDQQAYIEDRSEKWQESKAGQDYEAWMQEWGSDLEEISIDGPQDVDTPDLDSADALEGLSDAPG